MPNGNGWDEGLADGSGCGFGYGDGNATNVRTWTAAGGNGGSKFYGKDAEFYWGGQANTGHGGCLLDDGTETGVGVGKDDPESSGETWTTTRRDQRRIDFGG